VEFLEMHLASYSRSAILDQLLACSWFCSSCNIVSFYSGFSALTTVIFSSVSSTLTKVPSCVG
jgi:hypothetical protein